MNRRKTKQNIVDLLLRSDLSRIHEEIKTFPEKHAVNALFACLCHQQETVRWHAVSAFGILLSGIVRRNLEAARTIMRRFLWMLNDESGGIGWGVPEAMAEAMFHSNALADEYIHMLVSYAMVDGPELFQDGNFMELDRMQEGVLWGLCRVAPKYRRELVQMGLGKNLAVYFKSNNKVVRGLVCRLSGILSLAHYRTNLDEALSDRGSVRYYLDGVFTDTTISELAEAALNNLEP